MSILEFSENLHVEWNFELLGLSLSWDPESGNSSLRGFTGMPSEPIEVVKDALCRILIRSISTTMSEVGLVGILVFIDNHGSSVLLGVDSLFELLAAVQGLIDQQSRKRVVDMCDEGHINTDTVRACALTTYTTLLLSFVHVDKTVKIRGQFVKALVDMISRRKKKDYVNSFLRRIACECLCEIQFLFPGEVGEYISISLLSTFVQTETLPSFEGYTKLLLAMCPSPIPAKLISLLLDPIDSSSVWYRSYLAQRLTGTLALVCHHFGPFLYSVHVHLVHAFLLLALPFVSEWSLDLRQQVATRLVAVVLDIESSLPMKQLVLVWLEFLTRHHPVLVPQIAPLRHLLVPEEHNSWRLTESELQFQLCTNSSAEELLAMLNPRNFGVTLRFLARFLRNCPIALAVYPFIISDMLQPHMLPAVIAWLDLVKRPKELLEALGDFLNKIEPPSRVLEYSLLLEYLAVSQALCASVVLHALEREEVVSDDWEQGMKILRVCKLILLTRSETYCPQIIALLRAVRNGAHVDVANKAGLYIRLIETLDRTERTVFLDSHVAPFTAPFASIVPNQSALEFGSLVSLCQDMTLRALKDNHWAVYSEAKNLQLPFVIADATIEMYSVELSFSVSTNYSPFKPTKISLLGPEMPAYNVWLELEPIFPVPTLFEVFLEFTDKNGFSHKNRLSEFRVEFQDLFVPLSDKAVFAAKWIDPFAQLLAVPRLRIEKLISDRLAPFIISNGDSTVSVQIFLPPKFHLLFRFEIHDESCLVWIATDRPELLPLVDEFFTDWKY